MKYQTHDDIKKHCDGCSKLQTHTSKLSNKEYYFCASYQVAAFLVIDECDEDSRRSVDQAEAEMEAGIAIAEKSFRE